VDPFGNGSFQNKGKYQDDHRDIGIEMVAERTSLDTSRVRRALDNALPYIKKEQKREELSVERDSLVENTDRLEVEKDSLTSTNREYIDAVIEEYTRDLRDLESTLEEYRKYLQGLRSKESIKR
jgi:hypothetical protein